MKEKRIFICKRCGEDFPLKYRMTQKRELRYCSKKCAGESREIHCKSDIIKKAILVIKQSGKYLTQSELLGALGISSKTLVKYNISVLKCNKLAGMAKPRSVFELRVYEVLSSAFAVDWQVSFDDCLSPKGHKLSFDFRLTKANVLIEAGGNQHINPKHMWASDYYKACDLIKERYAAQNGMMLIRIPYSIEVTSDYVLSFLTESYKATTQPVKANVNA